MRTGEVLRNGDYQAVLLPNEARFPEHVNRVAIEVEDDRLVLIPVYGEDHRGRELRAANEEE